MTAKKDVPQALSDSELENVNGGGIAPASLSFGDGGRAELDTGGIDALFGSDGGVSDQKVSQLNQTGVNWPCKW